MVSFFTKVILILINIKADTNDVLLIDLSRTGAAAATAYPSPYWA